MGRQLPNEIIFHEILPRVPAKSLLQFRCVCKDWYELISSNNPYFIKSHYYYQKSKPSGVIKQPCHKDYSYHDPETGGEIFELKLNEMMKDTNTLLPFTSCYGLLVVQSVDWTNTHSEPFFYVCNPITRQFTKLPPCPYWLNPGEIAYDGVLDKYKVLSWSSKGVSIFTLGEESESSWRQVPLPADVYEIYSRAMWVNGCMYWVALTLDTRFYSYSALCSATSCVLCLDVSKEEITRIELPDELYAMPPVLVEKMGEVLYAVFDSEEDLEEMVAWVMDDWEKHTWKKIVKNGNRSSSVSVYEFIREIVARDRLRMDNGIMPVRERQRGCGYCMDHVNTLVSWDGKAFQKRRRWVSTRCFKSIFLVALFGYFLSYFTL